MMSKYRRPGTVAAAALAVAAVAGGCGLTGPAMTSSAELAEITVTSPAFVDGKDLPARFACPSYPGGQGKTPPLRWSGAPSEETKAFAIVVDDPDTSDGAYVGWVIVNIDGTTNELVEGARPERTVETLNTSKKSVYVPPCPPRGERHRYRFTLYALSERVPLKHGAPLKEALGTIAKYTIGRGRITGMFGRS
jgi:Raf kinase inhibitor-like YbhB/YbcL family protein